MRQTLHISTVVLLAALGALPGCTGSIGDGEADGRRGDDPPVDADSLAPSGQRRLTRTEYERTLRDLVGDSVVEAAAIATPAQARERLRLKGVDGVRF